jgi:hypothetical protein
MSILLLLALPEMEPSLTFFQIFFAKDVESPDAGEASRENLDRFGNLNDPDQLTLFKSTQFM